MRAVRRVLNRREPEDRGAVAVEAAIITPLLLLLVFGIIEFAFVMRDHVAVSSAVRVGGRMASASANAGPADCYSDDLACTPPTAPKFGQIAVDAVRRAGSAMPKDSIEELWVYKANDKGYPGTDGSKVMSCGPDCVKYAWVDGKDEFRYVSGSWDSSLVNACADETDAIGVYMQAEHEFITGLFGKTITVADHAVMAFEPLSTVICKPGDHP